MAQPEYTLGEYRVGITSNLGGNKMVNNIKRAAAALIDLIDTLGDVDESGECARLRALAMTHIEDGAMWAVKAAMKPRRT
jgi:hypothetical protein